MWDQSDKSMSAGIHSISTASIKAPGSPPLLMQHHLTTLEASTFLTKNTCSSKHYTKLYPLQSDLLCDINTWHSGLVNHNKLKPVLARHKKHNLCLRVLTAYKLKYVHFDYYMNYNIIIYAWIDIYHGLHISYHDREWYDSNKLKHKTV